VRISKLKIENFRGIRELELDLDASTLLIGANNVGKTTVLSAIDVVLGRQTGRGRRFSDYDHQRSGDDRDLPDGHRVALTITLEEDSVEPWPIEFRQALADVIQLTGDTRSVIVQARDTYDGESREFQPETLFLNTDGDELPKNPDRVLRRFLPAFYLPADRSASSDFRRGARFWSPFLRDPEVDSVARQELESKLRSLSDEVLSLAPSLGTLRDTLDQSRKLIDLPAERPVSLEPLPTRLPEALDGTEVRLTTPTGAIIPLDRHGGGTQNVAVLFLFQAYLASTLADDYEPLASPVLVIEEPEAHLHPSATRSTWSVLQGMKGQKVVATHSGELVSSAPLSSIRRMMRVGDKIEMGQVRGGTLSEEDERKVDFHIRRARGELLFGDVWLLGEGECEYWIFSAAAAAIGLDLEAAGIRVVDSFAQSGSVPLVKVADDLGIYWHCVADGDEAGQQTASSLRPLLNGRTEAKHITVLDYDNIEHLLCEEGFGDIYEAALSTEQKEELDPNTDAAYWKEVAARIKGRRKVSVAVEIADLLRTEARNSPPSIEAILRATHTLTA
jgi:putative ATP-dependent endonuclease of the OLD family